MSGDRDIEKSLRALKSDPLIPRIMTSDAEKEALIQAIGGPRTAASIRQALKSYSKDRIPFLFSSLEAQLVIDILENDVDAQIERLIALKNAKKNKAKT